MTVLKILIFPDQRLRTIAKEILVIDDEIKALASNLLETMYEGKGIGLSATQANIHKRILVVDVSDEKDSPLILINPKIEVLNEEEENEFILRKAESSYDKSKHNDIKRIDSCCNNIIRITRST